MNNAAYRERVAHSLKKRHARERRFRWYGRIALCIAFLMLAVLLVSILVPGLRGFHRTETQVEVTVQASRLDIAAAGQAARDGLKAQFPQVSERAEIRQLLLMLAPGYDLKAFAQMENASVGQERRLWLPVADALHRWHAGRLGADEGGITALQRDWLEALDEDGKVRRSFAMDFLTQGDSRAPEKAGMGGSILGTCFTLVICMGIAFPIGVLAAVYLEEFSRKGRLRDVIEVNINNLAAVPSIVFGLLGLAVFLGVFGLPRSSALVGGLTLSLMVLPVIIIATRAALQAVPPSIRDGARALGASPLQVVMHQVLPLAMPGILTGTILGVARAIGETAPLLMIGMVAFIADLPRGVTDPTTAMPVQIFLWAGSPERGFAEKTASAILVLIVLLLLLNALAIYLRRRYERRW